MPLNPEKLDLSCFRLALEFEQEFAEVLLKHEVHFRGKLHSLSLISLSKERAGVEILYKNYRSRSIKTLLQHIHEIQKKAPPKKRIYENLLQAWIIKESKLNGGSLPFDNDIKFITSELAITNKGNKYFMNIIGYDIITFQIVIIVLRANRLCSKLKENFDDFADIFTENYTFFEQLIQLYGYDKLNPTPKKAIVWPMARTSPIQKWRTDGIEEYAYKANQDTYQFENFHKIIGINKPISKQTLNQIHISPTV